MKMKPSGEIDWHLRDWASYLLTLLLESEGERERNMFEVDRIVMENVPIF